MYMTYLRRKCAWDVASKSEFGLLTGSEHTSVIVSAGLIAALVPAPCLYRICDCMRRVDSIYSEKEVSGLIMYMASD